MSGLGRRRNQRRMTLGGLQLQGRDHQEETLQRLHGRDRITTVFGY